MFANNATSHVLHAPDKAKKIACHATMDFMLTPKQISANHAVQIAKSATNRANASHAMTVIRHIILSNARNATIAAKPAKE